MNLNTVYRLMEQIFTFMLMAIELELFQILGISVLISNYISDFLLMTVIWDLGICKYIIIVYTLLHHIQSQMLNTQLILMNSEILMLKI